MTCMFSISDPLQKIISDSVEVHYAHDGAILKKRSRERVLYTVGYNIDIDRENHFRELIMLYLPWRNESKLIDGYVSFEEKYNIFAAIIDKNKQSYHRMSSSDLANLNSDLLHFTPDNDIIVPQSQQQNDLDELEGSTESQLYKCFDPGRPDNTYDLALDLGIGRNQKCPDGKKTIVSAIDSISGDIPSHLKTKLLSKIPEDSNKTKGLSKYLHIAEECPAELCANIDVSDGLANGTPCLKKKIEFRVPGSDRCSIIWVHFDEQNVGKTYRNQYKHLFTVDIPSHYTPIIEINRQFSFNYYQSFHVTRRQFPLIMSSAKTVHKAQGSTMNEAVIHFGCRKVEHMHYVALSRVKNLASVKILELNANKIALSTAVIKEMARMRQSAVTSLSIPLVYSFPQNSHTLIFHNCRSLHRYINDIRKDFNFLASSFIAFSETKLNVQPSVQYELPGFNLYRNDGYVNDHNHQIYHGTAIFTRNPVPNFKILNTHGLELSSATISLCELELQIGIVYCPPKNASFDSFKKVFQVFNTEFNFNKPLVIMGDFNVNLMQQDKFSAYITSSHKLRQLVTTPTTDHGSLIDHIYTNLDDKYIANSATATMTSLLDIMKKTGPLPQPLRVLVAAVAEPYTYAPEKQLLKLTLCDATAMCKAVVFDAKKFPKFKENSGVVLHNAVLNKDREVVVTTQTRVFVSVAPEVPADLLLSAIEVIRPTPPDIVPIDRAKRSPAKQRTSIQGQIVNDSVATTVMVNDKEVNVQTITVEDRTGKVKVSLWRNIAAEPVMLGDVVAITNIVVNSKRYNNEESLSSTQFTKIERQQLREMNLVNFICAGRKRQNEAKDNTNPTGISESVIHRFINVLAVSMKPDIAHVTLDTFTGPGDRGLTISTGKDCGVTFQVLSSLDRAGVAFNIKGNGKKKGE
ncbi:hypothetical protein MAR_034453 [Mya arenaria]|uniref:Uncharacterized protein n=1 Tax=Mya arenaria TaxID=6604 RepID=A0ABY7GFN7_MYAAR|nr:hypothetical protein MAR_034453 [Mya arenaria]